MLLDETNGGGLMGHFCVKKMEDVLAAHFFATVAAWCGAICGMMHYLQQS
jgi:hypothetical protein